MSEILCANTKCKYNSPTEYCLLEYIELGSNGECLYEETNDDPDAAKALEEFLKGDLIL